MIHGTRPFVRRLLLPAMGLFLAACAGLPEVQPVDIPRLEQEVATSPDDTDLQVQLGMAQFKGGELEAARATLRGAVDAGNESGAAYLYLGLVEEELEDWSAARDAYNRYLDVGESSPARDEVRKRLTLIGRNLLRAQARQALAQEQEITETGAVAPQSIAVLPMAFFASDPELEPLIYALSDMMITDFKVSNALVVLERAQIQTLLDEMQLTSAGYAEAETGARAGRLLRAEHVFQGALTSLGQQELQTAADVLNVQRAASIGELTESALLEQLFDMEKQIVIRTIREVLGVELTPAEEQRILENRMDNVLAFLAYGRGLRELDDGNYEAAQAEFDLALSLDPGGMQSMSIASTELIALSDAAGTTTTDLAGIASATGETGAGFFAPPPANTTEDFSSIGIAGEQPVGAGSTADDQQAATLGGVLTTLTSLTEGVFPTATLSELGVGSAQQSQNPTPTESQPANRDPVQEVAGDSGIAEAQARIRIVIQRPGGEQ